MNKTRTLGFVSALALIGTSAIAVAGDGDKSHDTKKESQKSFQTTTPQRAEKAPPASRADATNPDPATAAAAKGEAANADQANQIQPKDRVMAVAIDDLEASAVEHLQRQLAELGYYKGKIDGKIGPLSRTALRNYFADQQRLLARNFLGEHTLKSLEVDVTDRQLVRGLDHQEVQRQRMGGQDAPATGPKDADEAPSDRWQDNQSGDVRDY